MKFQDILIVDDSATSRMIIKRCFEIAGFPDASYHEAEDGLQALAVLGENKIDLILSDLKMPKMDGRTFIRKLRILEKTKHIPVVVISSMGGEVTESDLRQCGAQGIMRKPISPANVSEVMEEVHGLS